jgi:hypothetical protein
MLARKALYSLSHTSSLSPSLPHCQVQVWAPSPLLPLPEQGLTAPHVRVTPLTCKNRKGTETICNVLSPTVERDSVVRTCMSLNMN